MIAPLVVLGLVMFFAILPAKWDPAIRLKELNEKWGKDDARKS